MVRNQKPTGRAMSMPGGLLIGTAFSVISTLLELGILAKLIDMELVAWESVGYGVMIILLAASALGAIVACGRIKRQILAVSILNGLLYLGILLAITALFFGGQYEGIGVTTILVLGCSVATGLLQLWNRGERKQVVKKVSHR